jgi:ABC-type polysaccharide/polyol phosphate export permease
LKSLLIEIKESLGMWRYILYSACLKIFLRNTGSKLGLLWEPLSTLIVSSVLATVWIRVLGIEGSLLDYFIYVYSGMLIWGAISSAVSNLCASLVKNAKSLTNRRLPVFVYIFEDIVVSFIPFLLGLPFLVSFVLVSGYVPSAGDLGLIVLGIVLMLTASFGFSISVGLSAFFLGDVRQVVTAVMRLGFLVTPVIWKAERLQNYEYLLLLNPFYGYLHILRSGFTGEPLEIQYVVQAVSVTAFLLLLGVVVYRNMEVRIQQRASML